MDIPVGLIVGALWIVREIAGLSLQRLAGRVGRVGYVPENSQLLERIVQEDGSHRESVFVRAGPLSDSEGVYARYTGHLYNDAATPLVLREPRITYWGVDGPIIDHLNVECLVNGKPSVVLTVPAHGTCSLVLTTVHYRKDVEHHYFGAIPLLSFATVNSRTMEFGLRSSAPLKANEPMVAWDAKRRRVVRAGTSEWLRARHVDARIGRIRAPRR